MNRRELQYGDILAVDRQGGLYRHYAVYVGNGRVIHYAADQGDFGENMYIHEAPIQEFVQTAEEISICSFPKKSFDKEYHLYSPQETVARARRRIGEKNYNLVSNNCEHFAIWCKTGISSSRQVTQFFQSCMGYIIPAPVLPIVNLLLRERR